MQNRHLGLIKERLNRAFANGEWEQSFPNAKVYTLPCTASDHLPILVDIEGMTSRDLIQRKRPRIYRFEAMWLRSAGCELVVQESWEHNVDLSMEGLVRNVQNVSD